MTYQYVLPFHREKVTDPREKVAIKAARRAYKAERERSRHQRLRKTPEGWALLRWHSIKKHCYEKRLPFNILPEDILPPMVCPVLGTPFLYGDGLAPESPNVDRLVPELGYTRGNVAVISKRANQIKSDCRDPDDIRAVADWMTDALKIPGKTPGTC